MARIGTRWRGAIVLALLLTGLLSVLWMAGCDSGDDGTGGGGTTSSSEGENAASGDVEAEVGEVVKVGNARVTVSVLQATFQPVLPSQRVSEQTPSAPAAGEAFYQAYVRVENLGVDPIRADSADFTCVVDKTVVAVEVTRSGPHARSLLENASLDLVLTFKAQAGFTPELRYSPPWYDGSIRVSPAGDKTAGETSTTE